MHLMRYSTYYGARIWRRMAARWLVALGARASLAGDAWAVVDGTAGVGQGGYQAALLAGDAPRSHFGQGDMIRQSRGFGTSPAHVQILVKLIAVNVRPKVGLVQVIHALHVVGFGWGGELAQVGGKPALSPRAHLVVVEAGGVGSPHGIGQVCRGLRVGHGHVPAQALLLGKLHLGVVVVVPAEGHHAAVLLHVRGEKRRLGLFQDIQGRHLGSWQAIVFNIRPHGVEFSEVVEWGRLGVARLAAAVVTHAEVVTARLGKVMQEDIGFHPLDFLGLLLPPRAVLVVGVILEVLDSQPLGLFHKGTLVAGAQGFPRLACKGTGSSVTLAWPWDTHTGVY